jgi:type IV secretion system protein VirD4
MTKPVKRLLGTTFLTGEPIFAPRDSHSLLLSAAGGGKTTCGAMPWLLSLLPDTNRAIVINDCKDGEVAIQAAETCARFGRNVAILDETAITGEDNPFRVDLSPYGSVRDAFERENGELVFAIDNANHALIPEPPNDGKNQYFRDEPRTLLEFCKNELLSGDARCLGQALCHRARRKDGAQKPA